MATNEPSNFTRPSYFVNTRLLAIFVFHSFPQRVHNPLDLLAIDDFPVGVLLLWTATSDRGGTETVKAIEAGMTLVEFFLRGKSRRELVWVLKARR